MWNHFAYISNSIQKGNRLCKSICRNGINNLATRTATTAIGFVIRAMAFNPLLVTANFVCPGSGSTIDSLWSTNKIFFNAILLYFITLRIQCHLILPTLCPCSSLSEVNYQRDLYSNCASFVTVSLTETKCTPTHAMLLHASHSLVHSLAPSSMRFYDKIRVTT